MWWFIEFVVGLEVFNFFSCGLVLRFENDFICISFYLNEWFYILIVLKNKWCFNISLANSYNLSVTNIELLYSVRENILTFLKKKINVNHKLTLFEIYFQLIGEPRRLIC